MNINTSNVSFAAWHFQKLLRETAAPVHQHLGDEHKCPHRCGGRASRHAEGTHPHAKFLKIKQEMSKTQYNKTAFRCPARLARVQLRRTKRLLPSCPFLCQRSETWTLPTTPARSWSRLWGSFSLATSSRMSEGAANSGDPWLVLSTDETEIVFKASVCLPGLWRSSWRISCSLCAWCQTTAKTSCLWSLPTPTESGRNWWGSRTSWLRSEHANTLVCPSAFCVAWLFLGIIKKFYQCNFWI